MLVIRRNLRIVTAIVLASALFVAACSDVTPSDGASSTAADSARSYSFPIALGSMTTVWQASPGISLTTPDATLVRAFFEGSSKLAGHCSAVELLVVGPLGAGAVESYPAA